MSGPRSSEARRAVIAGAGPAGLTAALELLRRTDIVPYVAEKSSALGGISRTVNYQGNRLDIGGHRFFSKSDRVMDWWFDILPLDPAAGPAPEVAYHGQRRTVETAAGAGDPDAIMLVRRRRSRIFFDRQFFAYPLQLNADTLGKLGLWRALRFGLSYLRATLAPIRPERSLEDFLINRFGRALYQTFFQSYTEKVWGVPCSEISAEWGAQRIKGLSIRSAVSHFLRTIFGRAGDGLRQKNVETSLIEQFLYPKYGPGQMWERVAGMVTARGGHIGLRQSVCALRTGGRRITSAVIRHHDTGAEEIVPADYFFSTMPVRELIGMLDCEVPADVRRIADGLQYRDFLTVGLLVRGLVQPLEDNWVYVQEPDVLVGRLQVFNNWSPYLVKDPATTWLGLEYFCFEGDALWSRSDEELKRLASGELVRLGLIRAEDVLDSCVVRMEKTYPAYFGTYPEFDRLRQWLDEFENLYLIGRNGMHKYNNQDHSMLTAMTAVDNIAAGRTDKSNIWAVNTEQDYHESKRDSAA